MKFTPFFKLSISKKIPLLICTLLLFCIFVFGWISYVGVKKAAMKVGEERLIALTEQLSGMFATSSQTYITAMNVVGGQPAIKKYLLSHGKDSVSEALSALQRLRQDTLFVQVALFNADRQIVLNSSKAGINIQIPIDSVLPLTAPITPDSGRIGRFYAYQNSIYYPVISTVTDRAPGSWQNKKIIGYIIRWRTIIATPTVLEQLSKLIGTNAKLYFGNENGTLWTDMIGTVPAPPLNKFDLKQINAYSRTKNNPVIAAVRPIPNTPWLLSVEFSLQKILEGTHYFMIWIIIAAIVLLTISMFAGLILSRNITLPLIKLTEAATTITSGHQPNLLPDRRYDELGALSKAFNAMALQVKNSQQELQKKLLEYKFLFEKNPTPMWVISKPTLDIIDVNEAAIRHYGYSRDEFLRLNTKNLRPEEDIEKFIDYTKLSNDEKVNSRIWRHKKKDGTIIMADVSASDIFYKDMPARLILANDVTEKLKSEEALKSSEETRRLIMDSAQDAIICIDSNGQIIIWTPQAEKTFGWEEKEVLGKNLADIIIPPQYKNDHTKGLEKYMHTGEGPVLNKLIEISAINKQGAEFPVELSIVAFEQKGKTFFCGFIRDITERKNGEILLKELNKSLEKKAAELQASNAELERFAYVASHDLQEPLRMVTSFMGLLKKRYQHQLDDSGRQYIQFAVDGAERMKKLILDLLIFSQVDTNKEAMKVIDCNELVEVVKQDLLPSITESKAKLEISPLPRVKGNKSQLHQLFQNLIGNAIKYRNERTPVVKINCEEKNNHWQFCIQDNGIGIDPKYFEKIFVIFQRLHHKEIYSGTGIGLAISRKIVERHGGSIWVESEQGKGTAFYFTIHKK